MDIFRWDREKYSVIGVNDSGVDRWWLDDDGFRLWVFVHGKSEVGELVY